MIKYWYADKEKLLDAFSCATSNKDYYRTVDPFEYSLQSYRKLDYPKWREYVRAENPVMIIIKEVSGSGVTDYIVTIPGTNIWDTYLPGDCSFGKFLDHVFEDKSLTSPFKDIDKGDNKMFCSDNENDYIKYNDYRKYINNYSIADDHTTATQYGATTTTGTTINGDNYYSNTITTASPSYLGDSWVAISNETLKENDVRKICEEIINKNKEKEKMDTSKMFNFDFGPVSGSQFRMSPYGLAVRTAANGWVAFNTQSGELMDVEVLNFDVSKMIYKMPVALGAVSVGDILIHGGKPVFVRNIGDGVINVIDYSTASVMDILPVKSPFGFNFFTKVVCLVDMSGMSAATPESPFGGLLPFLMLGDGKDIDPMMFMFMGGNANFASNPMMMYFLLNRDGKDNSNLLPLLMMMNTGAMPSNNAGPATI